MGASASTSKGARLPRRRSDASRPRAADDLRPSPRPSAGSAPVRLHDLTDECGRSLAREERHGGRDVLWAPDAPQGRLGSVAGLYLFSGDAGVPGVVLELWGVYDTGGDDVGDDVLGGQLPPERLAEGDQARLGEIGRASCRERV